MKKFLKSHKLELIASSIFIYLLMFVDRFNWQDAYFSIKNLCCWTIYYIFMFVLVFTITFMFKSLILYIYEFLKKYYKKDKKNIIWIVIIGLIILLSIIIRIVMSWKHFTHCDDFGVAATMFASSSQYPWVRINFFKGWTYAPFQFVLNTGLVNPKYQYEHNLFLGRLPSLICGILNILLFFKLVTKIKLNKKIIIPTLILSLTCVGFSWENIIYSSQMEPYVIGITYILLILIRYIDLLDGKNKLHDYVELAVITALACYSQYQLFIFVFAVYLSLFIIKIKNIKKSDKKELFYIIGAGLTTLLASLPIIIIILKNNLLDRGLNNWSVGIHKQYLLTYAHSGILKIYDLIIYICKNSLSCIRTYFVFKDNIIVANVISIIMFIMCLIGIIYVNLNKKRRKYSLFFNIVLAIYLVLIILGKLALSPSRHTMVLIPILIYYMLYGFEFISKKYLKITNWLIIILAISINFIFFFDFKTEYKNRINPINTKYFNNLVEKYHPITISSVYWLNYSTNYLKLPGYIDGKTGTTRTLINKENSNNNIILIYDIDQKLSQERVEQVLNAIDNAKLPVKYKDKKSWKLLYKEETISKTEIEYAYGRFWNYPNSFYCYVIEMEV